MAQPRRRWLALLGLTATVVLLHLWLLPHLRPPQLGEGAAPVSARIQVSFVRELQPEAPPPAPPPRRRPPRLAALPAMPAASAPDVAAVSEALASTPDLQAPPLPPPEALPELAALAPSPAASTAEAAFEWPPSTRLSYTLTGDYQGPVQGQAQVEWRRQGQRYQVHLALSIGPFFAPLASRSITSEGEITTAGLRPRRYDEETRIALMQPRRLTIWLDDQQVRLPRGTAWPRPLGVQDSASQFVQMTWLFTTQPQWLQAGRSIELPLALPRRVDTWTYDVLGTEVLDTPAGSVQAVHVKPRREPGGGDLTAEFWVAPSLQNLPVRILIRQNAQTHVDLLIERWPVQAAPGR
jgi:hypothetical protein